MPQPGLYGPGFLMRTQALTGFVLAFQWCSSVKIYWNGGKTQAMTRVVPVFQ